MPITEAVGGTPEVLTDGSARSGLDVFKAVASGARGVMICRPWVWAMTGAGARGLDQMLSTMQAELQEAAPVPGRPRFDPTRFEEGLELLRNLLRQSDTRAGDLVEDLLPLAQGRPIAAELARAAELIAAYDYPAALSRLDGSDQIG